MNLILKNLLLTLVYSIALSTAVNMLFYAYTAKPSGAGYDLVIPHAIVGELFINGILFTMSLPALFLNNPLVMRNRLSRFLLYFSGVTVFIAGAFTAGLKHSDLEFYTFTAITFLIIHAVFYRNLIKNNVIR
jgi:hypothetical protein